MISKSPLQPLSIPTPKLGASAASTWAAPALFALTVLLAVPAHAQRAAADKSAAAAAALVAKTPDQLVLQARELFAGNDKNRAAQLAQLRRATQGQPLAPWVEYWELNPRLADAQQPELAAFFARWPGSYVEDRLRNDWLLELGKRRDWANFRAVHPAFRMNDDREVSCYALLVGHLDGQDVRDDARLAWHEQRNAGNGCTLMAQTLVRDGKLKPADVWQEMRFSVEMNRASAARVAAQMIGDDVDRAFVAMWENPLRYLNRKSSLDNQISHELALLALMRTAASDPGAAATQLDQHWGSRLPKSMAATAWAHVAKQAVLKQQDDAADFARRAWQLWDDSHRSGAHKGEQPPWSDELLAWHARAALREGGNRAQRWQLLRRATDAMPPEWRDPAEPASAGWSARRDPEQREGTWVYWRAQAQIALAKAGAAGDAERGQARQALQTLATAQGFYAQLAAADLGQAFSMPAGPPKISDEEVATIQQQAGFRRALQLLGLGLRSEGVREWNFSLIGLNDRQLLAAAQLACDQQVWDRCINTSERAGGAPHVGQRFPTPLREQLLATARDVELDPAVMYGLIRQESRFITDARSHVGASGLMQLMPATARWMAKKLGMDFKPEMVNDPAVNLRLGASYLKRLIDDFDGSLAMAAAAYNAGPGRPRRWREGAVLEPAAWAETIPFNETRNYVKKVLSNAVIYDTVLAQPGAGIKARLGKPIGPRAPGAAAPDKELP